MIAAADPKSFLAQLEQQHKRGNQPASGRAMKLDRSRRNPSMHSESARSIVAEYDAARTTTDNSRHWANADALSADEANSPFVRHALRNRARYEAQENNSYAKGMCLTLANDTIGTGPRLQMLTRDRDVNQQIERRWESWARKIQLASKLRTMRLAKAIDGETFAMMVTNERVDNPVQLDVVPIEAEQISTPRSMIGRNAVDGIEFDRFGNPTIYHLLKQHPGGSAMMSTADFDPIPASSMLHMYRRDRPGQHRGIPEITPALPLFAQLRRFTLATIAAAETAAEFAAVMRSTGPAIEDPADVDAMQAIEIEMRSMLSLPKGWDISQLKAEHPSTTYEMFRNAILNEIARCLNMPFNIAAGNSAGYNFASGRLDHQMYFKSIDVERSEWVLFLLDRLLSAWFDEAAMVAGVIPDGLGAVSELPHTWHWDGREHVDPVKEANAQGTRLANGTTTIPAEYAREGKDWEVEQERQAEALGIAVEDLRALQVKKLYGSGPAASEEEEEAGRVPEAA